MKLHQIYSNRWWPVLAGVYMVIQPLSHRKERTRRSCTKKSVERSVAWIPNRGARKRLGRHALVQFSVQIFRLMKGASQNDSSLSPLLLGPMK